MATTRRSGATASSTPLTTMPSTAATSRQPSGRAWPLVFLSTYPLILVLGSLYSVISPAADPSSAPSQPLAPGISSNINTPPPTTSLSYFARKDNILNQYFVKIGWLWTTVAFLLIVLTHPFYNTVTTSSPRQKKILRALLRFTLITTSWILTTQWFFGPALIDRSFRATGGRCEYDSTIAAKTDVDALITGIACKAAGGNWSGGHDISGHVFMLVVSSASLILELFSLSLPESAVAKEQSEEMIQKWGTRFIYLTIGLDIWMLFMTAIWFHTWREKFSGLAIALASIYGVYFLPRHLPEWRNIVGIPGEA